jgi:hypothetical protein
VPELPQKYLQVPKELPQDSLSLLLRNWHNGVLYIFFGVIWAFIKVIIVVGII